MPALGGLRKKMPITAYTMLVGHAGDLGRAIFQRVLLEGRDPGRGDRPGLRRVPQHFLLFLLPAVGATLTAFYMFRMWFLTFAGEPRGFASEVAAEVAHDEDVHHILADEEVAHGHGPSDHDLNPAAHAHESEPIMTWPLIILAVCSIFVGWTVWLGLPLGTPVLEKMIEYGEPTTVIESHWAHWYALGCSLLIAATGIGLGALYYAPANLPLLRFHAVEPRPCRPAVPGRVQAVQEQVVFRRHLRGPVRSALPGLRPVLRPSRQVPGRRPGQRPWPS